jgi:hypothetical protein
MHAHEMHAHGMHAYERHAHEMHAHEMHAYEIPPGSPRLEMSLGRECRSISRGVLKNFMRYQKSSLTIRLMLPVKQE